MPAPRLINLYKMICVALESRVRTRNGSAAVSDRRHNSIHIYNDEHTIQHRSPEHSKRENRFRFASNLEIDNLFIQLEHYNIY